MWPGRLTGTRLDRPIVLTAHYDSRRDRAAVQDNGSGMAALMEAARLITSQPCVQEYLVVFAAFDFEFDESPDFDNAACYNGYCGSKDFVDQVMARYLDSVGVNVANINGVIILDSILNFNDTLGAQSLPETFKQVPGLKEGYESVEQDGFKGNFILVAGRQEYDFPLYSAFYNRWDAAGHPQYKRQSVLFPLKDVVSAVETQSDPNWEVYKQFIGNDLTSFWNSSTDIKAMLLTDTLSNRGRGRPNRGVDDKMVLTDARLEFLKKITDVVTRTVMDLAEFKLECKGSCGLFPSTTTENLRSLLTDHFSENRHHVTNLAGKRAAADFIHSTFKSYGMQIFIDVFDTEYDGYQGQNIIGIWRGFHPGGNPRQEKPVILGAHYDTCRNNPGVDENGSGLAALMEAARVITSQRCIPNYSVVFIAFDLQCGESPDTHDMSACSKGLCGSKEFVENVLTPYMAFLDTKLSDIRGVIIMDSILNFNNTKYSQQVPPGFENTPLWDEEYVQAQAEGFRGNFISIFTRQGYDQSLYSIFHDRWDEECDPKYKRRDALIPYKNIADEIESTLDPYWGFYQHVSQDLGSFWKASDDIKGLLLSDTEQNRGREVGSNEKLPLTDERLGFLKKITNVVIRTTMDLAGFDEFGCIAPASTAPQGFDKGMQLDGKISLPEGDKDYSLVINTFELTGRVDATLFNSTWSIDMSGKQTAGGTGGLGTGVVVGLLVGVILTLLVVAAVWFFRKRRPSGRGGPSFQPLQVST
ncbi:Hypp3152 [Branchiostoma lanceolatum]|uniref:Hypp3152 protein n=1 Tax=Branchiostoma lanceolatum TaxID=7740 RepID=A0A8J9ZXS3_BRALA|nr:Hypp3152 [Branchiostoma lanceolatum]